MATENVRSCSAENEISTDVVGKNYVETSFGLRFRPVSSGSNSPEKKIGAVAAGFPKTLFGTSESGAVLGAKVTFLRDSDLD